MLSSLGPVVGAAVALFGQARADAFSYDYSTYQGGRYGTRPSQTFQSSPVVAPLIQVNSWDKGAADPAPYLFVTTSIKGAGPMIYSAEDLSLVYADMSYVSAWNARVQAYRGENFLTFWEGDTIGGRGEGYCLMFDETYTLRHNLSATSDLGALMDVHECKLTADGTALISVYKEVGPLDLTAFGGPADGSLMDSFFQEIDVASGKAIFTWQASAHFQLSDSLMPYGDVWDWFHLNSVDKVWEDSP